MMMKKLFLLILALLCLGCANDEPKGDKGNVNIVTSFYPMYVATINVADGIDGVTVSNLTEPQTGCLHDYQLSTKDMKNLEKADVLVVNGGGMESFIDKVVKEQPKLKVVDASKDIEMIEDEEGTNPHVWVSISNAIKQVENIAAQLGEIDPEHKSQYDANAKAYIEKLAALRQEMHEELAPFAGQEIVTFHEAFPYFADEFNLKLAAVIEREPGSEPTPTELKDTIEIVQAAGIKALFTEPQYSPKAAETIASATGANLYVLDPVVTGEATPEAKDAYIVTMKKNLATLKEAFSK